MLEKREKGESMVNTGMKEDARESAWGPTERTPERPAGRWAVKSHGRHRGIGMACEGST